MMRAIPVKICRLVLLLLLLSGCQQKSAQIKRPQPLAQDPLVEVYFNRNQAQGANYTDPYRQITRSGDNLEQMIIEAIATANSSVDVAVQELNLPGIATALAERHQAGVKVRVILENSYSRPLSELTASEISQLDSRNRRRYEEFRTLVDRNQDGQLTPQEINTRDALVILRNAGIPVIDDTADGSKGSGLMHHKFVVVDGVTLLTGSANFTLSGVHGDFASLESRGNANNLLKINSPQLAQVFTQEFDLMWGDGVGGKPDSKFGLGKPWRSPQNVQVGNSAIAVFFPPTSSTKPWQASGNGLIGKTLQNATESINLALFVFSEQKLANILEKVSQTGTTIKALIDPGFVFRDYSEGLDMLGVALSKQCKYEQDNRPWQVPITTVGVPQLPQGDKLHHKFSVVDGQTVITGSHNWSVAANSKNDETIIIIQNPTVAAHFTREFERLYSQATLGISDRLQQKLQAEKQCIY